MLRQRLVYEIVVALLFGELHQYSRVEFGKDFPAIASINELSGSEKCKERIAQVCRQYFKLD